MSHRLLAFGAALFFLALPGASAQLPAPPPNATIWFAHDERAIELLEENAAVTRRMVDRLVMAVTRQPDVARAWASLVTPADRVGIKVSTAGGRYLSSHRGVVEAIVAGLADAGIPRAHIFLWDRNSADLRAAGFTADRGWMNVRAIDPPRGFDRAAKFTAPVIGKLIWGDLLFEEKKRKPGKPINEADQLSSASHLASILTREVTKIINVPVLCDESGCGVAGALYNVTVPNIDNWRRFTQLEGAAASSIAELYADERIGPRVVLHLMDGLLAQYAGGPRFAPHYTFAHATLYASRDPVALDANASRLIDAWRKQVHLPPLGRRVEWLQVAAQMGLGQFEESRIELRNVAP